MKFLAFAASHRKASVNRKLARLASDLVLEAGAELLFLEYGTLDMPIYDDETCRTEPMPEVATRFIAALRDTDGLIIAAPEYNWSFPGSLKNIIDWASVATPQPFAGKTALLLSASPSLRGGAQGLVHLKAPLDALSAFVFPRLFTVSLADRAFNEEGRLTDIKIYEDLQAIVSQFLQFTERLKSR